MKDSGNFDNFIDINYALLTKGKLQEEQEILQRIAVGDERAFRQLFDQYWESLYLGVFALVKSKELAHDMLQEIFLKIWKMREELPEKDNIHNFLYIVARNYVFNQLRKKSQEITFQEHLFQHFVDSSESALERLINKESREIIDKVVQQLPEQQRLVYVLTRQQGLSQDEICKQLNISKSTVKTHMSRALNAIREEVLRHSGKELVWIWILQFIFNKL